MSESLSRTAFLTLPNDAAVIGTEITKAIASNKMEMQKKVQKLNGQSAYFKVVELELSEGEFTTHGENKEKLMISGGTKAVIKNVFSVDEFINS
jgi:hypothetical protein